MKDNESIKKDKKSNFFLDNKDILFQLKDKFNLKEVREFIDESSLKEQIEELIYLGSICSEIDPIKVDNDRKELETIKNKIKNLKLFQYFSLQNTEGSYSYSNKNIPFLFNCVAVELLAKASPSLFMEIYSYSTGLFIVQKYLNHPNKEAILKDIKEGGGVSLYFTEDSGSDLSDTKSQAIKQEDGSYRINGVKNLIVNADSAYAVVLAKDSKESSLGLRSLKLFFIDVKNQESSSLNIEKLDSRISYKNIYQYKVNLNSTSAYPLIVGKDSILLIQDLLNRSKLIDSFAALGMLEAARSLALSYTKERRSWGKRLNQHESVIENLLDMTVDTVAFRSFCYQTAYFYSYVFLARLKLEDKNFKEDSKKYNKVVAKVSQFSKYLKKWIPCLKWWAGEKVPQVILESLRLHGGYGLLSSSKIQLYYRDSLALAVQNSPSHIQSILLTKILLKDFIRRPSEFIEKNFRFFSKYFKTKGQEKLVLKFQSIFNKTLFSLISSFTVRNLRYRLSLLDYLNISEIVGFVKKNLIKLENTKGILLYSGKLIEMQSIILISRCFARDFYIEENKEKRIIKYLESKFKLASYKIGVKSKSSKDNDSDKEEQDKKESLSVKDIVESIKDPTLQSQLISFINESCVIKEDSDGVESSLKISKKEVIERFFNKNSIRLQGLKEQILLKDDVIKNLIRSLEEDSDILEAWKGF